MSGLLINPNTVLLRTLEYYSGLLFLTTNRIGSIDEAFRSRIHISLLYPPIGEEGTLQIWRNNIERVSIRRPEIKMDKEALISYAAKLYQHQCDRNAAWNGRQVTNAFQSAIALADFSAPPNGRPELTTAHFQRISETSEQFDELLSRIQGGVINDFATDRRTRPSIDLRQDRYAIPRSRSGLRLSLDREHSSNAQSSGSTSPALQQGPFQRDHSGALGQQANPSVPQQQPYVYHQPMQNSAFPFQIAPQQTTNLWPQQMQQPLVVPAGMFYAMQTQHPWSVPMSSVAQQQSPFSIPGQSPYVYYQGQGQAIPQFVPMQTDQQHGNNISNPGTTIHPSPFGHTMPPSSYPMNAAQAGSTRKWKTKERRRPESHMSQESRQPRYSAMDDDEGFWSRLKRDS